jgi:signal recognition particle receptor subunit beta
MVVKILIISCCGTGKTSYVEKLKIGKCYYYETMFGFSIFSLNYKGKEIEIYITNEINEEVKYKFNASCVIYMLSDEENSIKFMHSDIKDVKEAYGDIPSIVLFNKSDIPKTIENYNLLKNYFNLYEVMLCSAKDNTGIYEPIDRLIELIFIIKFKKELRGDGIRVGEMEKDSFACI